MAEEAPLVAAVEAAPAPVAAPDVAPAPIAAETAASTLPTEAQAAPVEAALDAPTEPAEPAPVVDAKPEPITYADWTLPEGLKAAPEQLTQFNTVLAEHGLSQEAGQKLMDLHGAALKAAVDQVAEHQRTVFDKTQADWRAEFDKRAGNRRDTIANDAKWALTQVVPKDADRARIIDAMNLTGAGNHPDVVFAFAAVAKRLRERQAPPPPTPHSGSGQSKAERRYNRA